MDKTWTNIGQKLDKTCTFVEELSKFCPTPHSTGAPQNDVYAFVHNKEEMIFPKFDGIYGSAYLMKIGLAQRSYQQIFFISRTHWRTLSNENKMCDEDHNTEANLTRCYTRYLENTIGCSIGMLGSNEKVPW